MKIGLGIWIIVLVLLAGQTAIAQTTASPWAFAMGTNYIDLVAPQFGFSHQLKDANWEGPSAGFPIHIELGRQITPSLNFTASYGMVKLEDATKYQQGGALGVYDLNISNPYYWGMFGQMEYSLANGYIFKEDALIDPYVTLGVGNSRISQNDFFTTLMGVGIDIRSGNIGFNTELDYAYLSERDDYIRFKMGIKVFIGKKRKTPQEPPMPKSNKKEESLDESNKADKTFENQGINITINIGSMGDGSQPYVKTEHTVGTDPGKPGQSPTDSDTGTSEQPNDPETEKPDPNLPIDDTTPPKITPKPITSPIPTDKRIHFDIDKYDIKPQSFPYLNNMAEVLKENPSYKVKIEGHTDNTFTREYNYELSENRAFAVREYLIEQGVPEKQILPPKGYGPDKPIKPNNTEEQRSLNRRTELILIKG